MSSFTHPIAMSAPFARSVAIAALMGATILASPLTAARADTATNAAIQLAQAAAPQNPAAAGATETKGETVEQRITDLHAALKITPDQDTKWNAVAQAMRENAAAMDKLIAATRTTPPQNMTAVDDLRTVSEIRPGACRRAEEPDFVLRDALRCDARCPEEDRRRGVQTSGRGPLRRKLAGLTIAFRDRDTTLIRGGRYDLDHRHQIETPSVGKARGRIRNLRDPRPRGFAGSADARSIATTGTAGLLSRPAVVYGSPYGSSYYGSPYYYTPPIIYPSLSIGIW